MEKDKTRRISTPGISSNMNEEPFHNFRSLRTHRSHNHIIQKKPEVSVILEVDTDTESAEERHTDEPSTLNKNESRPSSMNSVNFECNPKRMGSTRDSRRSTKSTISTKSLNLTTRQGSGRYGTNVTRTSTISTRHGQINGGFQHSNSNLHSSMSSLQSTGTAPVIREQYFCCRKWSRREKILTTVVATLLFLVCGLVTAIGLLAVKRAERNNNDSNLLTIPHL